MSVQFVSNSSDNSYEFGPTCRDRVVSWASRIAGMAPGVGPIISELITQLIPEQRLERIEGYIKRIDERLTEVEREKLVQPRKIDLFEDGAFQAIRSLSEERMDYIAEAVAKGLSGEKREEIAAKRMLKLLHELDDDQIILLASRLTKNRRNDEFRKKHSDTLEFKSVSFKSSPQEAEKATMRKIAEQGLVRLGLLDRRLDITQPGLLFLRYIDLAGPRDY